MLGRLHEGNDSCGCGPANSDPKTGLRNGSRASPRTRDQITGKAQMVEGVNQFAHALKFPPEGDDVTTATYFNAAEIEMLGKGSIEFTRIQIVVACKG